MAGPGHGLMSPRKAAALRDDTRNRAGNLIEIKRFADYAGDQIGFS